MTTTRGVLYIHSAPSALCPHIEWAVGGVFGTPISLDWVPQPVERASYRCEYPWVGPAGSATAVTSALKTWGRVRFEITEEGSASCEGQRYCYTPTHGVFRAVTGQHGDIMIAEDRIKHAMVSEALGGPTLLTALEDLLGRRWDDELEPFRHAGEATPVRWLHKVV